MFDVGAWEILVIGVMALVILGPERLPGAIKSTISTVRSIKQMANGFKQEVVDQLDVHELHENLKKAEAMGMENIGGDIKKSVDELKAAAASVQEPYKKSAPNPDYTKVKTGTQASLPDNDKEAPHAELASKLPEEPAEIEKATDKDLLNDPNQADLFLNETSKTSKRRPINE